jgi:MFS transporter, PPP family, 3-phenylpropionic acid transporter
MVGIVISSVWVPNAVPAERPEPEGQGGFFRQLCRPSVLAFFVCVGLMQVSHGPYYTFFTIHLEHARLWPWHHRPALGAGVVAEILIFLVMAAACALFVAPGSGR